jgi:hypothetical protein
MQNVKDLHVDVLLMQELGVNWARVDADNQWKKRAGVYLCSPIIHDCLQVKDYGM